MIISATSVYMVSTGTLEIINIRRDTANIWFPPHIIITVPETFGAVKAFNRIYKDITWVISDRQCRKFGLSRSV